MTMVMAVSDGAFAEEALSLLVNVGVSLEEVQSVAGATGVAIVCVQDDDENSILLNSGANLRVTTERVEECADLIAATDVLVLQGEVPPRPSRPQPVTAEAGSCSTVRRRSESTQRYRRERTLSG